MGVSNYKLSTMALNSARFSYISPAGLVTSSEYDRIRSDVDCNVKDVGNCDLLNLVDGGYFENFGAETALEIAALARRKMPSDMELILVQISSNPD
jgi:hypothetical protein